MTEDQILVAQALERCTMLPGSFEKRFVRDMAARSRLREPQALTDKQASLLVALRHRFRRQLSSAVPGLV